MKNRFKWMFWFFILLVIVGGIWFYVRRNTGMKLLSRAETALKASRLEEADKLAHRYTVKSPEDWRGWCVYAQIELRRGKYEYARELLTKANKLAPDELLPMISLADSYAWAGRYTMARRRDSVTDEMLEQAVSDFKESLKLAKKIKSDDIGQMLDIRQSMGLNARYLGDCYMRLHRRYLEDATILQAGSKPGKAQEKRDLAQDALVGASRAYNLAGSELLYVVKTEPTRKIAGRNLAELCLQQGDLEIFDQAKAALLDDKADMPEAQALLWMDELQKNRLILTPPQFEIKIDKTIKKIDKLLRVSPDNRRLLLARLQLSLLQKDDTKSDAISKKLIDLFPLDNQCRLLRAKTLMKQGKNRQAEDILFELKTDYPNWPEAHFVYAQAVGALGKQGLARQALRRTTQIDPNHSGALRMVIKMMLNEGFGESAYTDARTNYEAHKDDPQALALFIKAALQTRHAAKVEDALIHAEKNYRDRPAMMLVVAEGYRQMGDAQRAKEALKPAAESDSKTWQDKLVIAKAKQISGDIAEAEQMLVESLQIAPNSPQVNFALGGLYSRTNRQMQAIEAYSKACSLAASNMRYRKALAEAYFKAGLLKNALRETEVILDVEPQNTAVALLGDEIRIILDMPERAVMGSSASEARKDSLLQSAKTQLQHGKPETAILLCKKILAGSPKDTTAMLLMADAYLILNQFDLTLKECRHAIEAAPNSLPTYLRIGLLLRRKYDISQIETFFHNTSSSRTYYEHIMLAWLSEREGKLEEALRYFNAAKEAKDMPQGVLDAIDLRIARVYAKLNDLDRSMELLNRLIQKPQWKLQALIAKARIELDSNRPIDKTLDELLEQVRIAKNASLYDALVLLALQGDKIKFAEKVCEYYRLALPKSARPFLMSGFLYNYLNDKRAIAMYREAIRIQPMNLRSYIMLSRVYNRLNKSEQALKILKTMALLGPSARFQSLYEQSRLFASWGLHLQAVATLEQLNDIGNGLNPQVQYSLGSAFALLGEVAKARDALVQVPAFASEYIPAQMLIAALATSGQEKIEILDNLLKVNPRLVQVRLQLVDALLVTGNASRADQEMNKVVKQLKESPVIEPLIAVRAVGLLMKMKQYIHARDICQRVAAQTRAIGWQYRAMLFDVIEDPVSAVAKFEEPDKANLFEAAIGIMASGMADEPTKPWADRFKFWMRYRKSPDVAWFIDRYELLAAIVDGKITFDDKTPKKPAESFMPRLVVESLLKSKTSKAQAEELMVCQFAIDIALPSLAKTRLMNVLEKNPSSQWAGMLLLAMNVDDQTLEKVQKILIPSNCFVSRLIKAERLLRDGKADDAYMVYSTALAKYPENEMLKFRKAVAAEQSGKLEEALKLYKSIWKTTGNPIAANNAASVISRLYPKDPDELNYASSIMTDVLKMVPNSPAFMDTKGWIEFLRGNDEVARGFLANAIKGLQGSPEAHYHIGMVEKKVGTLGVWHLQAAISNARIIQARSKLSLSAQQAVELSEQQLRKMKKPL